MHLPYKENYIQPRSETSANHWNFIRDGLFKETGKQTNSAKKYVKQGGDDNGTLVARVSVFVPLRDVQVRRGLVFRGGWSSEGLSGVGQAC